jgi:hypothetical protein
MKALQIILEHFTGERHCSLLVRVTLFETFEFVQSLPELINEVFSLGIFYRPPKSPRIFQAMLFTKTLVCLLFFFGTFQGSESQKITKTNFQE